MKSENDYPDHWAILVRNRSSGPANDCAFDKENPWGDWKRYDRFPVTTNHTMAVAELRWRRYRRWMVENPKTCRACVEYKLKKYVTE